MEMHKHTRFEPGQNAIEDDINVKIWLQDMAAIDE
jgi:hypothetical protein